MATAEDFKEGDIIFEPVFELQGFSTRSTITKVFDHGIAAINQKTKAKKFFEFEMTKHDTPEERKFYNCPDHYE